MDASPAQPGRLGGTPNIQLTPFESELSAARNLIAAHGGFATVTLPFSEVERSQLARLEIKTTLDRNYFGTQARVRPYLEAIALELENTSQALCGVFVDCIERTFDSTLKASLCEAGWLCIRSFQINPAFEARWHTDGSFFVDGDPNKAQMKLAFCLKGRSTLFTSLAAQDRNTFDNKQLELGRAFYDLDLLRESADEGERERATQKTARLQRELNVIATSGGEVVEPQSAVQAGLFAVGHSTNSALHSEPPFDQARIFVSIVVGSAAQISALRERWQARNI